MNYTKVGELLVNPSNPRIVKDDKYKILKESLASTRGKDVFEARPVIVSNRTGENIIIAGNTRYRAAKDLGWKEVPTVIMEGLTEEQEQEIIIRDNVSNGEWDWSMLANEWDSEKLQEWGLDVPDIETIDPEVVEDDYEVPDTIKTDIVLGDIFEIGEHRLLCGDSSQDSDYTKILYQPYETYDLLITDPPYGVKYEGKTKDKLTIENDAMDADATHQLWRDVFTNCLFSLKDGGSIYVTVPPGLLQVGFMQVMLEHECLRQCMVWNKGSMVLGHSDYHYKHEPILYGWKPGATHYFTSDRTKTTVFDYAKPTRNADHPTMKPVELWAELISNSSKQGEICFDPFLGSGTTMVASHQLKRKCYGIELDPKYCQVIVDRMKKLDPTLVIKRNGEPWVT